MEPFQFGLILVGFLLAFAGEYLFRRAITVGGGIMGALAGVLSAAGTNESVIGSVVAGAIVGMILIHVLYFVVVTGIGFLTGGVIGFLGTQSPEVALGSAMIGAMLVWILETVVIIVSTALVGSALIVTGVSLGGAELTVESLQLFSIWTIVIASVGIIVQAAGSVRGGKEVQTAGGQSTGTNLSIGDIILLPLAIPLGGDGRDSPNSILIESDDDSFNDEGFRDRKV